MSANDLSVTHRFTVDLTDYVDGPLNRLLTRSEAREILWQVLYDADDGPPWTLNLVDEPEPGKEAEG